MNGLPVAPSDLEGHQSAAVIEVDAGPVPANRLGREVARRPFAVEPGAARHHRSLPVANHGPGDRQLRHRIIIARLLGVRPLAAIAPIAVQHRGLGRGEGKVEREFPCARRGVEDAVDAPVEVPVEQRNAGIPLLRLRDPEALPGDALVVDQPPPGGVGECRVREDDLARREDTGIGRINPRPRAEEGDLEPDRPAVGAIKPASEIPPFCAIGRMRAMIARKAEFLAWHHDGIGGLRTRRGRGPSEGDREQGKHKPRLHHQSSLTARTASRETARRPATVAVAAAVPISAVATPRMSPQGMRVVMVQLNDCGLITWIRIWLSAIPIVMPAAMPTSPRSAPSMASIATIWPLLIPTWRIMPNSLMRTTVCAVMVPATP